MAESNGQFKKVPVSFTGGPDLPGAVPGGQLTTDCTSGGACVAAFNFGTGGTVAGDLVGDYVEVFAVGGPAGGGRSILTGSGGYTGSVKRCGTGSFVWTESGVVGTDGSYEGTQTIFPGSGTGDLVGITRQLAKLVQLGQPDRLGPVQGEGLTRSPLGRDRRSPPLVPGGPVLGGTW